MHFSHFNYNSHVCISCCDVLLKRHLICETASIETDRWQDQFPACLSTGLIWFRLFYYHCLFFTIYLNSKEYYFSYSSPIVIIRSIYMIPIDLMLLFQFLSIYYFKI